MLRGERVVHIPTEEDVRRYAPEQVPFGLEPNKDELQGQLVEALQTGDHETVSTLLRQDRLVDALVLNREFAPLNQGFESLSTEILGRLPQSPADIERLVAEGVSPFFLAEMSAVANHEKRELDALRFSRMVASARLDDPVAIGHAINNEASVWGGLKKPGRQQQVNERALRFLASADFDDPRVKWIRAKVQHGLAFTDPNHERRRQTFLRLLADREKIGDIAHIGATQKEIARSLAALGRFDEAEAVFKEALAYLERVNYVKGIGQVTAALAELPQQYLQSREGVFSGFGKGERLEEMEERWEQEERNQEHQRQQDYLIRDMRIPAHCVLDFGGRFLLRVSGEGKDARYATIPVDQQVRKSEERDGVRISQDGIVKSEFVEKLPDIQSQMDPKGKTPRAIIKKTDFRSPQRLAQERERLQDGMLEKSYRIKLDADSAQVRLFTQALDESDQSGYVLFDKEQLEYLISNRLLDQKSAELVTKLLEKEQKESTK